MRGLRTIGRPGIPSKFRRPGWNLYEVTFDNVQANLGAFINIIRDDDDALIRIIENAPINTIEVLFSGIAWEEKSADFTTGSEYEINADVPSSSGGFSLSGSPNEETEVVEDAGNCEDSEPAQLSTTPVIARLTSSSFVNLRMRLYRTNTPNSRTSCSTDITQKNNFFILIRRDIIVEVTNTIGYEINLKEKF